MSSSHLAGADIEPFNSSIDPNDHDCRFVVLCAAALGRWRGGGGGKGDGGG